VDNKVTHKQPNPQQTQIISAEFSGPIPHPSTLKEYEEIKEGFADRIISMAERQQKHHHSIQKIALKEASDKEKRGQHYALGLSVLLISCTTGLIALGHDIAGGIFGGSTLLGLAYLFINNRQRKKKKTT